NEPFSASGRDFMNSVAQEKMRAKWRSLQPVLQVEAKVLQACRNNPAYCTPATSRFLAVIDAAKDKSGRARIGEINRAVNLAVRPVDDMVKFHVPDVWTTPLMTFASESGDCEDYAIAKYVALREAGFATADLRIVILRSAVLRQDHAVAAVRLDGEWLVLDNRTMLLRTDAQLNDMTPLASLDTDESEPVDSRAMDIVAAYGPA
ncbi:MAG: transglutaminase-like cysteine peptidase, partial [Acidimicrobiales bacterium]|nr:transglutaminase-like cysteine peptidase [Acidimicrobiales bacterium]